MAINGVAVAYMVAGGVVLYSGIRGATISDTVKSVLSGNLSTVSDTETIPNGQTAPNTSGLPSGNTGAANQSASQNQALAKQLATSMGYSSWTTGQTWDDWVSLWNQESGWSATADNPTSGAYGIPQALPYTKMPTAAWPSSAGGSSDPTSQITWGIQYIAATYGNPEMAWAHETTYDWY